MGRRYNRKQPKKSFADELRVILFKIVLAILGYFFLMGMVTNMIHGLNRKGDVANKSSQLNHPTIRIPFDVIDIFLLLCMIVSAIVLFSVFTGAKKREQQEILESIKKAKQVDIDLVEEASSLSKTFVASEDGDRVRQAEKNLFLRTSKPQETSPKIYKKKRDKVLTAFETRMYDQLKEAFPDHLIQYQVGLSQLVDVNSEMTSWVRRGHFSKIARLILDFVIVDQEHNVIACIELDDWSHQKPDRQDADRRKNEALESAGYQLLRYTDIPSVEELRRDIFN